MTKPRIIVGVSGATGFVYAVRALELLRSLDVETHLVVSKPAQMTRGYETSYSYEDVKALADVTYAIDDVGAAIASGSFLTMGMLVAPCSMHSLAAIAMGLSDNLLTRSADVALKERRRLVLMTRESPLNLAHIRNMEQVTLMGGVIFPPVPAFYHQFESIDDMVSDSVARALSLFDIKIPSMRRWGAVES
ncbi:MAG: UbiX family flavin prenyltransferase [Saezia sp.]